MTIQTHEVTTKQEYFLGCPPDSAFGHCHAAIKVQTRHAKISILLPNNASATTATGPQQLVQTRTMHLVSILEDSLYYSQGTHNTSYQLKSEGRNIRG